MLRLIGVGDNTVDTYVHERMRYPGGNAVNVAVLARRYGIQSAYLGAMGDDERGALILDALRQEDVDVSHCKIIAGTANGYAEVNLIDGERVFGEYSSGAAAHLVLDTQDLAFISGFEIVHSSVYSCLEAQLPELKVASRFLCYDFSNQVEDKAYLAKTLPFVDLAVFSLSDHPHLEAQAVLREIHAAGAGMLLITQGKNGSWFFDGVNNYHQDIMPAQVVDTMGAGDAFIAAFLVELFRNMPLPAAMASAAVFAAKNCEHSGAFGYGQPY